MWYRQVLRRLLKQVRFAGVPNIDIFGGSFRLSLHAIHPGTSFSVIFIRMYELLSVCTEHEKCSVAVVGKGCLLTFLPRDGDRSLRYRQVLRCLLKQVRFASVPNIDIHIYIRQLSQLSRRAMLLGTFCAYVRVAGVPNMKENKKLGGCRRKCAL